MHTVLHNTCDSSAHIPVTPAQLTSPAWYWLKLTLQACLFQRQCGSVIVATSFILHSTALS